MNVCKPHGQSSEASNPLPSLVPTTVLAEDWLT